MSKRHPDAECECPVGTTAFFKGRWWRKACSEAVPLTFSSWGTDTVWKPEQSNSTSQCYGRALVGRQFMGNMTTFEGYRLDERQSLHNANRAVCAECSVKLTLQEPDIRKLANHKVNSDPWNALKVMGLTTLTVQNAAVKITVLSVNRYGKAEEIIKCRTKLSSKLKSFSIVQIKNMYYLI